MNHDHHDHLQPDSALAVPKTPWTDWLPLIVVIGYVLGSSLVVAQLTEFSLFNLMAYTMGFFFVFFSLFKFINLSGFAMGYAEYDIISKRWYSWGYVYPFIELGLGVLYLLAIDSPYLHSFTILMSIIICIGVGIKLAKREMFHCACLGTVLKVPLTKVSLIEYAVMGGMAIYMLAGSL
ncbi:MAG: MauE/DoxX family redox-associated membrane protein [Candidatus Saccharimonadales bacterium]